MSDFLVSFFISNAYAADAPPKSGGLFGDPIMLIGMIAIMGIFYFISIRPQQKKAKEAKAMLASLGKGDEISTIGGVVGKITALDDNYVTLEVSKDVEMKFQRQAVGSVLPKGTIKNL